MFASEELPDQVNNQYSVCDDDSMHNLQSDNFLTETEVASWD